MAFPTTGLVWYWKLEESSGTRVDSHGTNHLTPTNAPVGAAGKIGNGCDFESSSSQSLSHASNSDLSPGDVDFTFTLWIKFESFPAARTFLIAKDSEAGREYGLSYWSGIGLRFEVVGSLYAELTFTPVLDTWYFVVASNVSATNTVSLQLNNGVLSSAVTDAVPSETPTAFWIGARQYSGSELYFDGLIDEVGLWRRVLTAQERTDLYNGGAGLAYAPPAPPVFPTANLVSYWRLDEASGTRQDSHGTNHLTPTNAPVGAAGKIGNGCDFESSSSQYLSHADPSPLGDEDWTYTLWFRRESPIAVDGMLIGKDHNIGRYYTVSLNASSNLSLTFLTAGVTAITVNAGHDENWHFVVAWHNAAADTINVQLDNGAVAASATSGNFPLPAVSDVRIGARQYPGFETYFDGLIDEVGLWRRVLTAQERTDLYNSGAGLAYAPPAPPVFPTANLVSYWRLDEASGTRVDSHGTNHLTPTNAPVGAAGKIGNGCDFESSSSQYLSHADPTPLGDESWTYTLWFKHEAVLSGSVDVIGKSSPTYYIRAFGWGVGLWIANDTKAITVTAPADTNWHFLIAWHDATANTLNMQYDNGTVQTGPTDGVFPAPNVLPDVTFGQFNSLGYFDGLIDEVGLWRRVLTAQERTDLYNGGAGLAYSTGSGVTLGGDLTTRFATYLKNLRSANPGKDLTTLVAKDLPIVRAAHPLPTEVDDRNTLYNIHLD